MSTTNGSVADPIGYGPGNSTASAGRLASQVDQEAVIWIADGLIPQSALTLVVGVPGAGKSSLGAWLCARAKRPAILPGSEESIGAALLPRLVAARVPLDRCLLLDGRQWVLPPDRSRLAEALANHQADFLWIDPIDPLIGDLSENDGQAVRACLEALHWIAERLKIGIAAARHPGKARDNVCPGSRQWRAVPRVVLRLDLDHGPPLRRFLVSVKAYGGVHPRPREYNLVGEEGEPCRLNLGPEVSDAEAALGEVSDWIDRRKIDVAAEWLENILIDGEQPSTWIYTAAEAERLSDRTLVRAAHQLGVRYRREGQGRGHLCYWFLAPGFVRKFPPPPTVTHTGGGVCISPGGSEPEKPKKPRKSRKGDANGKT